MTNPILAFSARRRMRSIRTPIVLSLYSLLLVLIAYFCIFRPFTGETFVLSDMKTGAMGYALIVCMQFGLLILVAPAMISDSISGERERQTLDLLLVTQTSSWQLVVGKLLESFGFLALMVLCSVPMLSLVLITGGASFGQVLISVLFLLLVALAALSLGLFVSTLCKRTVTATVLSYVAVLAVGAVTFLPLWYDVKRIGDLYDAMNILGKTLHPIHYTPVAFTLCPALGLFSLLMDQTHLLNNILWGVSHSLANTRQWVNYGAFLGYHMIFLACASFALVGLAAFNLRAKKGNQPKKKVKKHEQA
ncbi:MAG: ABC transporter permease [Clostridia bacterium]